MPEFKYISPSDEKIKSEQPKNTLGIDRRTIIKGLFAAGALAAGAERLSKVANNLSDNFSIPESALPEESSESKLDEIRLNLRLETLEQARIKKMDEEIIGQTLEKQIETQDHITLDSATERAIYQSWRQKYIPGGSEYTGGIVSSIKRMGPWMEEICQAFRKNGIDEKYIFLTIAESNFDLNAVSGKKAVGPYQIMYKTAIKYGLIISEHYDERLDPVKSAEVCARHLKDNYKRYGSDWDLTLMDYNGGFTNDYLNHVIEREKARIFSEEELQKMREHHVRQGDMLEPLAEKYGTSVTLFMRANPEIQERDDLTPGMKIKIPPKRELSMADFKSWIEKKMNARIRKELKNNNYAVKPGEFTLRKIAEKYEINYDLLKGINSGVSENNLKAGQIIHVPAHYRDNKDKLSEIFSEYNENINYPKKFHALYDVVEEQGLIPKPEKAKKKEIFKIQRGASLKHIAKLKGIELGILIAKNPAVLNSNGILPPGATIYL